MVTPRSVYLVQVRYSADEGWSNLCLCETTDERDDAIWRSLDRGYEKRRIRVVRFDRRKIKVR